MVKNFAAYPHFLGKNLLKCLCIKGFREVRVDENPSFVPSLDPHSYPHPIKKVAKNQRLTLFFSDSVGNTTCLNINKLFCFWYEFGTFKKSELLRGL